MTSILNGIENPNQIKELSLEEMDQLAQELRDFMVEHVSQTGGHLAPSLGVVELILSLCVVFDFEEDKVIFDVGHQSYAYKILTGRRNRFSTLRQWDGLSGFPKGEESPFDAFNTGHSSTSISAGLGMAFARDLKGESHEVVSVIGDGALTGGMAFEALNNAGNSKKDLIVILNDNEMSISANVGAMADYLSRVRTSPKYGQKKQDMARFFNRNKAGKRFYEAMSRLKDSFKYLIVRGILFEEMGFTYLGPIDGHDIGTLTKYLKNAKSLRGPVLLHVITKKGKGYLPSETDPDKFHGVGPFHMESGEIIKNGDKGKSFSQAFGENMLRIAKDKDRVVAITAAMPDGTGLASFAQSYPERFFDVGIAEQHAVTFGAGLAKEGMKPFIAIYSSFLQRAYDQVLHDVCLQKLPVVLGIDRAGIVGEDGETHQGIYDIAMLKSMPDMVILSPSSEKEMKEMMDFAAQFPTPLALRYPRGAVSTWDQSWNHAPLVLGKGEMLWEGGEILLIPLGIMIDEAIEAAKILREQGIEVALFNPRFVKPLDEEILLAAANHYKGIVTIEDHVLVGGFGASILELFNSNNIEAPLCRIGLPDESIRHGKRCKILSCYQMDARGIAECVKKMAVKP